MDLTVKTALPNTPINWQWPVQVGLAGSSAFNSTLLRKYYWAKTLSIFQRLAPGQRMNIMLFNGIAETQKAVALFTNKMPQADVILIKMPQAFFNSTKNETDALAIAAKLAQLTEAGGVFFFATAMPDSKWFDTLMIELSHNLGIAAALNKLTPMTGWGFTAPGLEKATQLSAYIEKMSTALVSGKFRLTKPVQYFDMKTGYIQTSNHKQLGSYFLKNLNRLDYSGEIKTASVVLEVNKALKAMPITSAKPPYKPTIIPVKKGGGTSSKPIAEYIKTLDKKKGGPINIAGWPETGPSRKPIGRIPVKKKAAAKPQINRGGGAPKKKAATKAAPKLPAKKKFPRKPNAAFIKVLTPSSKLAALVGNKALPRTEVVKKMWQYIKTNNLQDAKNKNIINADAKLKAFLGGKGKVPMTEMAKLINRSLEEKSSKKKETIPRYLQADINKTGSAKKIATYLLPDTNYDLNIMIGEKGKATISAPEIIDVNAIFIDPNIKEAVIDLIISCNTDKKLQHGRLVLPREGDSEYASFPFFTGNTLKRFEATIVAYYKGRQLQKTILSSDIRTAGNPAVQKKIIMKVEAVLQDMSGIEERAPVAMSLTLEKKTSNKPSSGLADGKPFGFRNKPGLDRLIGSIRDSIDSTVTVNTGKKDNLDNEENVTLLRKLATNGRMLFTQQLGSNELNGSLQIVNNTEAYIPLEFVYSYEAPLPTAVLCPNAKKALKDGACKNCFTKKEDKQKHICPFGFWGLSHVIERHDYSVKEDEQRSDYVVKRTPGAKRKPLKVLNRILHAETLKVEDSKKGTIQKVHDAINNSSPVKPKNASDWDDWLKKVNTYDPDSLVLIVHLEDEQETAGGDALEIGDGKTLLMTLFDKDYINASKENNTPFVILIGCEISDPELQAFDPGSLVAGSGAAIVLSNFTRIQGKHAGDIVIRLMKLLKANAKKEIEFGQIILQLKQQLVAEGIMVALTLLSYGDADWKIKT